MEIKERVIKIITSEGLSSAAFADTIGVQRSSISHILSGRNNPSLDFLQKILSSFPKYNAEWLLMGLGEMYKLSKQTQPVSDSLIKQNASINVQTELALPQNTSIKPDLNEKSLTVEEEDKPIYNALKAENNTDKLVTGKQIHKIVVFYSDKTFGEYQPE